MLTRRMAVLGALLASTGRALAYPARTVTIIVPFAPGGSADSLARIIGGDLGDRLGTTVIIENRGGGGGVIGLTAVSRADSGGQVLGVGATGAIAINPHVAGAPPFDPLTQLKPIAKLVDIPLVLVSSPAAGLKTIDDVVRVSKANSAGLNCASTGINSSQHLSIELLRTKAGANLVHIPYKGSAPANTGVLSGEVPLGCVDLAVASEHIKAGTLVAIGVTAAQRYSVVPGIPTFAEQGLPGFDMPGWIGLFGPLALADDLTDELSRTIKAGLEDRAVVARIEQLVCSPGYLNPAAFRQYVMSQSAMMKTLVDATQAK